MQNSGAIIKCDFLPSSLGVILKSGPGGCLAAALYSEEKPGCIAVETAKNTQGLPGNFFCDLFETRRLATIPAPLGCLERTSVDKLLRALGKTAASAYHDFAYAPKSFEPGTSPVPVSGKAWGPEEMESLIDANFDFWLTTGRFNDEFESKLKNYVGARFGLTVNSGSSANLVALAALTSSKLKDRRLKPGDEVLTVAACFPTTVTPIIQNRLVPVFVDVDPITGNILAEQMEAAIGPRTRAVFLAHILGNPFNLEAVLELAKKYNLWVIEDCCDALDAKYTYQGQTRMCGTFGHFGTYSFYPAHHMTMGEGGAVLTGDPDLYKLAVSFRDWGRDCWCAPGRDNTCKRRYSIKFPNLPAGYDHKYVYSHLGYNLKITDMQAAVGVVQIERLPEFCQKRRTNFKHLTERLAHLDGNELTLTRATPNSDPCWFGYLMTLRADLNRQALLEYLNSKMIGTRLLFAGNITRQPCFEGVEYRAPFSLTNTDRIMNHAFWVGVYHGLGIEQIDYIADSMLEWFAANK